MRSFHPHPTSTALLVNSYKPSCTAYVVISLAILKMALLPVRVVRVEEKPLTEIGPRTDHSVSRFYSSACWHNDLYASGHIQANGLQKYYRRNNTTHDVGSNQNFQSGLASQGLSQQRRKDQARLKNGQTSTKIRPFTYISSFLDKILSIGAILLLAPRRFCM